MEAMLGVIVICGIVVYIGWCWDKQRGKRLDGFEIQYPEGSRSGTFSPEEWSISEMAARAENIIDLETEVGNGES